MPDLTLMRPVELTEAELDAVGGGATGAGAGAAAGGLVAVAAAVAANLTNVANHVAILSNNHTALTVLL